LNVSKGILGVTNSISAFFCMFKVVFSLSLCYFTLKKFLLVLKTYKYIYRIWN